MKRKINANILRWFANFNCNFPKIINYLSSEIYHGNSGKFSWKIVKVLRKDLRLDWVLCVTAAQADSRQRLLWQKRLMHLTGRKSTAATSHCLSLSLFPFPSLCNYPTRLRKNIHSLSRASKRRSSASRSWPNANCCQVVYTTHQCTVTATHTATPSCRRPP